MRVLKAAADRAIAGMPEANGVPLLLQSIVPMVLFGTVPLPQAVTQVLSAVGDVALILITAVLHELSSIEDRLRVRKVITPVLLKLGYSCAAVDTAVWAGRQRSSSFVAGAAGGKSLLLCSFCKQNPMHL